MMEFATASEKMESVPNVSEPYVDGETIDAGASFKTSPGTLMLSKEQADGHNTVALYPVPTSDPNDPLNWSKLRKTVNFTLACSFVFFTFALINAGYIPYAQLTTQLGFTFENFTTTTALSFTGFALSSVFILPFIHKCGRRWIYLLGSILQFTAAIWLSQMNSPGEMMGAYTLAGMGGGLSEALLQITIVDLFFVHQRATMSGFFLLANTGGSGLGPLAGGYIVTGQSWRWMFRWAAIFLGINLLLVLFFFEESKYIPSFLGRSPRDQARGGPGRQQQQERLSGDERQEEAADTQSHPMRPTIDSSIKRTTIRQRLALFTVTDTPVLPHLYQPFVILFTFPAVAYTAITYGALTTWYTVLVTVAQPALVYPPYNFQASGVGLFIFSVSIGCGLGCLIGAPLNDKSVIWFAARNGGIHEPETRLYMALIAALPALAGIFMVGLGLAHEQPWPLLAVGLGIFGFCWVIIGDCALAYVTDCYQDIIGDAIVGVVFTRNALAIAVEFGLSHWLAAVGLQNLIVSVGMIALFFFLLPVPLLIWGKRARISTAEKYRAMASRLPSHRAV